METSNIFTTLFKNDKSIVALTDNDFQPFYTRKVKFDFKAMEILYVKSYRNIITLFKEDHLMTTCLRTKEIEQHFMLEALPKKRSVGKTFLHLIEKVALQDVKQQHIKDIITVKRDKKSTEEPSMERGPLESPIQEDLLELYRFILLHKDNILKDLVKNREKLNVLITQDVIQFEDGPLQFTINRKEFKYLI